MTDPEKYLATFYPSAPLRPQVKAIIGCQEKKEQQPHFPPEFLKKTSMLRSH